jgi:hypothetical protein
MSYKKCFICKELEIYDNGKTCYNCDEDSFNIGRKQGAVEELEHLLKVLDEDFGMPRYSGEIVVKFMKERLKELKEGV